MLVSVCALSGCAVGPDYKAPEATLPSAYVASTNAAEPRSVAITPVDLRQWWRMFRDPELNSLIDRALISNLDLEIAMTRVEEARARLAGTGATDFPNIALTGGGGGGTGSDNTNGRLSPAFRAAENSKGLGKTSDAGGFVAGWDLDLFGKVRRELEAERADAEALKDARDSINVLVVADVARAYLDLRARERQLVVLGRTVEAARATLGLAQSRLDRGLTNELDVDLARRQLATLEAARAPLNAQIENSRHALAVLLGQFPETMKKELARSGAMPSLPARIPVGVPLDLLRRRPDIAEAEHRLMAANARVGSAIASLFPSISLTGALGDQQGPLATKTSIPANIIWTLGPSISAPFFDFGALDAQIEVADLKTKEALIVYRRSILRAVQEVDDAVATYKGQQQRLLDLERALAAAREATRVATERYDRGLTDFLNALDAQRQQFSLELSVVEARQVAGQALVALFKALGGGWSADAPIPSIRMPDPAAVAAVKYMTGTKP